MLRKADQEIYHPNLNEQGEIKYQRHEKKEVVKSVTEKLFHDRKPLDETLNPNSTQTRAVVRIAKSDELNIRKLLTPNNFDRVKVHDNWHEEREKEKKKEAKLEAKRKRWEKLKKRLSKSIERGDSLEEVEDIGDELKEYQEIDEEMDEEEDEVALAALSLREKRLCQFRNTYVSHNPKGFISKFRTALALSLDLGWRDPNVSEILPWLWVGDALTSANLPALTKMGITHILNVTSDLKNHFPDAFIYKQLAIEDSVEEDLNTVLERGLKYIGRVAECRGRILVHCRAGVSRSVSLTLAYLITEKSLSLSDAYDFVSERRPVINVNDHFLFQLAELEVKQGLGSSVLDRKDVFRSIIELNLLKTPDQIIRPPIGLWSTTYLLLSGTKTKKVVRKPIDTKPKPNEKSKITKKDEKEGEKERERERKKVQHI
mmetsp:Transcript_40402/g.41220  ORF Transcript_40402/g.41220 Transcript_40402/m.41220 type:complete len:430 (-) Transcript_40402:59-1348(-)